MGISFFRAGVTITISGVPYRLLHKVRETDWQVEHLHTKCITELSDLDLQHLYVEGKLELAGFNCTKTGESGRLHVKHVPLEDMDMWQMAKCKRQYVIELAGLPCTKKILEPEIKKVWARIGGSATPPSFSSVCRWRTRYNSGSSDIRVLLANNAAKGNRRNRYPEEVSAIVDQAIDDVYLTRERKTIEDCVDHANAKIFEENLSRPSNCTLPMVTRRFTSRKIAEIAAFDRYIARFGFDAALRTFRSVQRAEPVSAPLDVAHIDHTRLDLFVIDDGTSLPLGRPYVTTCLDAYSRCVLGIYLGFEPPSYLTVAECLQHALLPKPDLQALYPDIHNVWNAHGAMRVLILDNGPEFHSHALESTCLTIGIELRYIPRKQSWLNGKIERFHQTLNGGIAHGIPGTTFSNIFEKDDYDPSKHAVVRLSTIRHITYKWIVDVYHQKPHRSLKAPPATLWSSAIHDDCIPVPTNPTELEAMFGRPHKRRLTHRGVELDGLHYNSPELTDLRKEHGNTLEVEIRASDRDLGQIIVLSPNRQTLYRVRCIERHYADGLTRWQHSVCKHFARARLKEFDVIGWTTAKEEIAALVHDEMENKSARTRVKSARFNQFQVKKVEQVKDPIVSSATPNALSTQPLESADAPVAKRKYQPIIHSRECGDFLEPLKEARHEGD